MTMEEGEEDEDAEVRENFDDGDTEFSFDFSCSMSFDLPQKPTMLSAEELFFNGKLRLLQAEEFHQIDRELPSSVRRKEAMDGSPKVKEANFRKSWALADNYKYGGRMGEKTLDLQRSLPMVKTSLHESLAMTKEHLRSLHESPRCLSMTVEGSRGQPRRSCASLTNSRCSSPSRARSSGTFSQPPTTPTSPKAHSSQKNRTVLHYFRVRKHLTSNKDALFPTSESVPASSSRSSRTFWPFSRSNSAGESKSSHGVLRFPQRSNSAGESKTTSSALLPSYYAIKRNRADKRESSTVTPFVPSGRKPEIGHFNHQQADKKGSPPLPSCMINSKKTSSCFVLTNCGSDPVALSQPVAAANAAPCIPPPISRSSLLCTPMPSMPFAHTSEEASPVSRTRSSPSKSDGEDHVTHTDTHTQSSSSVLTELKASASPGTHMRHASANNFVRSNMTRGSPARQWSNPNVGGSSTRSSLQRFGPPPSRALLRPKDALSRETVSLRVAPVLNVPVCMTPSSKSKLFNLSNLFSKKEKATRGYTMLVSTDSQSGG